MAKFKSGESGNPQGRPAGSKNRSSTEIRAALLDILNDNLERLQTSLETMEDKEVGKLIVSLAKHLTAPEVSPERLSIPQLEQIIEYLKSKKNEEE